MRETSFARFGISPHKLCAHSMGKVLTVAGAYPARGESAALACVVVFSRTTPVWSTK